MYCAIKIKPAFITPLLLLLSLLLHQLLNELKQILYNNKTKSALVDNSSQCVIWYFSSKPALKQSSSEHYFRIPKMTTYLFFNFEGVTQSENVENAINT